MSISQYASEAVADPARPGSEVRTSRVPEPRTGASTVDWSEVARLVEAASAGDSGAWNKLVDRFSPIVWAIARGHHLNAADAADVSQTTWLRLVENLDRIEQPERVGAWLATTARRESQRVLRLSSRQTPTGEDFEVLPDHTPIQTMDQAITSQERSLLVNSLVDQLPTRSQVLLRLLSADSPLSYRDISDALDMPIGSIGPTRARALQQLRCLALQAGVNPDDVID